MNQLLNQPLEQPVVLVLGGTGQVGRQVLAALHRRGATARVLVRDPARLDSTDGLDVRIGDLRDATSVRDAVAGADMVFHISPHEADEVALTQTVIDACERAGARLVFAGVYVVGATALTRWLKRCAYGLVLPRYRGKFEVGRRIAASATRPVILALPNFMQTDEVLLDAILDGELVQTCHPKGLNRIDLQDVGEIAASLLLDVTTPATTYPIVGPASLSGPECAEVWSRALGRPVRYAGDDPAAVDAALARNLTGHRLEDWRHSFRALRRLPVPTPPADLASTTRLLGRPPTDYASYVARVVALHGLRTSTAAGVPGSP